MNAKNKLADLLAAFDTKTTKYEGGDSNWKLFYPFWKMEVDSVATVRFLPDLNEENPLKFIVEKHTHELYINGKRKTVTCLNQDGGSDCPICAVSRKHYDAARVAGETREAPGPNMALGKRYYRKKSFIASVIVVDSPIEHDQSQLVKLIDFGPQLFDQIMAGMRSGDLEEYPYELIGGYNFRIRKTKNAGGKNSYNTSNFAPKQSNLDDDVISAITLYDLAEQRGKILPVETLESMLLADQTGQAYAGSSDGDGDDDSDAAPAQAAASPAIAEAAAAPAVEKPKATEKSEEAPKAAGKSRTADIIAQYRARAAAAKTA